MLNIERIIERHANALDMLALYDLGIIDEEGNIIE